MSTIHSFNDSSVEDYKCTCTNMSCVLNSKAQCLYGLATHDTSPYRVSVKCIFCHND